MPSVYPNIIRNETGILSAKSGVLLVNRFHLMPYSTSSFDANGDMIVSLKKVFNWDVSIKIPQILVRLAQIPGYSLTREAFGEGYSSASEDTKKRICNVWMSDFIYDEGSDINLHKDINAAFNALMDKLNQAIQNIEVTGVPKENVFIIPRWKYRYMINPCKNVTNISQFTPDNYPAFLYQIMIRSADLTTVRTITFRSLNANKDVQEGAF